MPPSPALVRCRGVDRSAPLLLALPLLLAGCSGTPFGEGLSRSFSGAAPAGTASPASPASPAAPTSAPKGAGPPGARSAPAAARSTAGAATPATPVPPTAAPPTAAPPTAAPPAAPAPYRVTILLPEADPAAPAEVVTRALRAAGVPFEVETIQRTGAQSPRAPGSAAAGSAPPAAPVVAPPAPAAPTVRPAPPPR